MQHILVIDDDPALTSLLKRGLSYEGFVVETARSGGEGLTQAREHAADFDANVVEVYVKQLRQKLEAQGEVRLIHTIRNVGYVLREQ